MTHTIDPARGAQFEREAEAYAEKERLSAKKCCDHCEQAWEAYGRIHDPAAYLAGREAAEEEIEMLDRALKGAIKQWSEQFASVCDAYLEMYSFITEDTESVDLLMVEKVAREQGWLDDGDGK